jgi:hypothetical protein
LIDKYNLLPKLYRYQWPKVYAKEWDSAGGKWKQTFKPPESLRMGGFLKSNFVKKELDENTMTIKVRSRDSTLSLHLAETIVEFLGEDIKSSVRNEANDNVTFLEKQLITVTDPLLREKIQSRIAEEIEKTMVVSKEAFKIIDPVFLSETFKEIKLYPMIFGAGLFFVTVLLIILRHALSFANSNEQDRQLILRIKKELYLVKNTK